MRLLRGTQPARALTLMEVLLLIVAVLVLAALALTFIVQQNSARLGGLCVNNLKQVGLAFRVWANDNDDTFPYRTTNCLAYTNETQAWLHYFVMSNELGSARILTCPQDTARLSNSVLDFSSSSQGLQSKSNRAVSYFIGLSADESLPDSLLSGDRNLAGKPEASNPQVLPLATNLAFHWNADLHTNQGNVADALGAVHYPLDRWRLQKFLARSGLATNHLLLPLVP